MTDEIETNPVGDELDDDEIPTPEDIEEEIAAAEDPIPDGEDVGDDPIEED